MYFHFQRNILYFRFYLWNILSLSSGFRRSSLLVVSSIFLSTIANFSGSSRPCTFHVPNLIIFHIFFIILIFHVMMLVSCSPMVGSLFHTFRSKTWETSVTSWIVWRNYFIPSWFMSILETNKNTVGLLLSAWV